MRSHNRIEVMHGVNLDQLGRRDPSHYGGLTFDRLEQKIAGFAAELGLQVRFFHTNAGLQRVSKFQAFRRRQQLDGENVFRVLHNRPQLERRRHSH